LNPEGEKEMTGLLRRTTFVLAVTTLSMLAGIANAQSDSARNAGGNANAGVENNRTTDATTNRLGDWGWLGLVGLLGLAGLIPRTTDTNSRSSRAEMAATNVR